MKPVVAFAGTLPSVGGASYKEPKLHTSDTDPVSSKTGAGAPNPMTHTKDIDYTPNLTTKPPPSSGFTTGTGTGTGLGSGFDSKPGTSLTVDDQLISIALSHGLFMESSETGSFKI